MFVDHEPSLVTPPPAAPSASVTTPPASKTVYIAIAIAALLFLSGAGWWYFVLREKPAPVRVQPPETKPVALPGTLNPSPNDQTGANNQADNYKGETVTFDAYYKSLADEKLELKITGVALPLNVKSQVSNYYEMARRLDLDPALADLNKNGFAVIDSPFGEASNDFFGSYAELNKRGIPFLVTADFLNYYYQNSLKQIYDEVKASYFYDSLWKVNKDLFEAANARYQERRQKVGIANDPLLEAERLEAGYYATSLALLTPQEGQVNATEEINATSKFKPSEAKRFSFTVPSYLADDIARENVLITTAKRSEKSPLFLYSRDYTDFQIPAEYTDNAKLKNFFRASRWQSSLFPLDYKNPACPSCLLDRDDWTINQIAAYLVAEDLSSRQSLKNEWAKIYKVTAFFSGLRSDLTYLDYQAARETLFPKKSASEIFAADAHARVLNLNAQLQKKAVSSATGGLSRKDPSVRPALGLRLLQTSFWPDRYIYDRLTYAAAGNHIQPRNARGDYNQFLSSCVSSKGGSLYRCRGISFDILGAVSSGVPGGKFLLDNINYQRYASARAALQKEIAALSSGFRHGSNFWLTLDTVAAAVHESFAALPFTHSGAWSDHQLATSLGASAQLGLPADSWEAARSVASNNLSGSEEKTLLSYVEPSRQLPDQLVANTTMIFKTLAALGVVRENDAHFTELLARLQSMRMFARNELSAATITPEAYQSLDDIIGQYKTVRAGLKTNSVSFYDPSTKRTLQVKQSTTPLKLLLLVYAKDGKNILVAGPIFNFREE